MNKNVFALLILLSFVHITSVFGQSLPDSLVSKKYVYCELSSVNKAFKSFIYVVADFGDNTNSSDNHIIKDEKTERNKEFNSMVDALNFMSDKGWEVVSVYTNVSSNNVNNITTSSSTYLLKKIKEAK